MMVKKEIPVIAKLMVEIASGKTLIVESEYYHEQWVELENYHVKLFLN